MLTAFTRQNIHTYSGLYFQIVHMKKHRIKQARPLGDDKQNLNSEMTHREQIQNTEESISVSLSKQCWGSQREKYVYNFPDKREKMAYK